MTTTTRRVLRRLSATAPVVVPLRALTHHDRVPWRVRTGLHRRIGKRVPLSGTFSHDVYGTELRLYHGPISDYYFWLGRYERETTDLFARLARDADLVIDVGARDGIFACIAAVASPSARVLAFDPEPDAIAMMQSNFEFNRATFGDRVSGYAVAVSDQNGDGYLYLAGGNSSLNAEFRPASRSLRVALRRGDDLVAEHGDGRRLDLVKIDTESTEPQVLEGLRRSIETFRPAILVEVLKGRTEARIQSFVDRVGYRTYAIGGDGVVAVTEIAGDPTYRYPNFLLWPAEKPLPRDLDEVGGAIVHPCGP
jgi:FkbM family methyltransferase